MNTTTSRPLALAWFLTTLTLAPGASASASLDATVNALWGDASWVERYGAPPTVRDSADARVAVHLEAVLVRLRDARPPLSAHTLTKRATALDALEHYIRAGEFPRNIDDHGARSEFIDHRGRLCAVGHLVAVTAGRDVAEAVDAAFSRDNLFAMVTDAELSGTGPGVTLLAWAQTHGFTPTELALIQPSYTRDWYHPRRHTNLSVGARFGAAFFGHTDYSNDFEALSVDHDPALDGAINIMWEPGVHWGLGLDFGLFSNLEDVYDGTDAAWHVNARVEYAIPVDWRGALDVMLQAQAGFMFAPSSPGSFSGFNYSLGLGLSTNALRYVVGGNLRLDVRFRHHLLDGGSESLNGYDVIATLGWEWRFNGNSFF